MHGKATFTTVYPGWYQGRAVHIHFKVRTDPDANTGFDLTSQLFFDDEVSRSVYTSGEPYQQKGAQDVPNAQDGMFGQSKRTRCSIARRRAMATPRPSRSRSR